MSEHIEGLGRTWQVILDDPQKQLPNTIVHTLKKGGTRECWQRRDEQGETIVMAWPDDTPFRIGVTMHGKPGKELRPVTSYPLLEGLPNDMTVEEYRPWKGKSVGTVAACRNEGASPVWFFDPFLFRDYDDLTPGVRHTFLLSGLAYGMRKALLDEMTVTEGPSYEQHAQAWLEAHPGASRLDVPQLTMNLRGARILMPGEIYGDYQLRAPISAVDSFEVGGEKIHVLTLEFGLNTPNPLRIPIYAPARVCKDEPLVGLDIDALVWLQGRILDTNLEMPPFE